LPRIGQCATLAGMDKKRTLAEIAVSLGDPEDQGEKPGYIWHDYEALFAPLADLPLNILEIGVYKGVSVRTLASYFASARIVGLDLSLPAIDPSRYPSVSLFVCDQRDAAGMGAICDRLMPGGIDIVIDDASHVGEYSFVTYRALFPRVKAGGLYIVEDWATGYWPHWGDGAEFSGPSLQDRSNGYVRRIVSHDYGMVGFVKSLIDEIRGPVLSVHANGSFVALTKRG
jgi:hypothetical protein